MAAGEEEAAMGAWLGRGGGRGRAPLWEGSQVALEGGGQRLALEALLQLQVAVAAREETGLAWLI